jgi:anthranilate phosphoribosyltransferase
MSEYKNILEKLINKINLNEEESERIAQEIINGKVPESVTASILVLLRAKGESSSEIRGFARAMRNSSLKVNLDYDGIIIDTAGTGGDSIGTINVSTVAGILASRFVAVAKHGNRSVSSLCGSADFLETVGYNIVVAPDMVNELLRKSKFVFLYAPFYHPAMRNVINVRKVLGIKTIFNILGPLTNPLKVKRQVSGVYSIEVAKKMAEAALELDYEKLILLHGYPGIDEVSPIGKTYIFEVKNKKYEEYYIDISEFGLKPLNINNLLVKSAEESVLKVIRSSQKQDDVSEFISINTSIALYVAGIVRDFKEGYEISKNLLPTLPNILRELVKINGDPIKLEKYLELGKVV